MTYFKRTMSEADLWYYIDEVKYDVSFCNCCPYDIETVPWWEEPIGCALCKPWRFIAMEAFMVFRRKFLMKKLNLDLLEIIEAFLRCH